MERMELLSEDVYRATLGAVLEEFHPQDLQALFAKVAERRRQRGVEVMETPVGLAPVSTSALPTCSDLLFATRAGEVGRRSLGGSRSPALASTAALSTQGDDSGEIGALISSSDSAMHPFADDQLALHSTMQLGASLPPTEGEYDLQEEQQHYADLTSVASQAPEMEFSESSCCPDIYLAQFLPRHDDDVLSGGGIPGGGKDASMETLPSATAEPPGTVADLTGWSRPQREREGSGRQRLRPWLQQRVDSGQCPGLEWLDKATGLFRVPWKHGGKQNWCERDSLIFKEWAVHTGRFREGVDRPDWPSWKTRFRCALNKLPDIVEVRERSRLDGNNPYRVYRFIARRGTTACSSPLPTRKGSSSSLSSVSSSASDGGSPEGRRRGPGSHRRNIPTTVAEHLSQKDHSTEERSVPSPDDLDADLRNIDDADLLQFSGSRTGGQSLCKEEPMDETEIYTVEHIKRRIPPPLSRLGSCVLEASSCLEGESRNADLEDDFLQRQPQDYEMSLCLRYRGKVVRKVLVSNPEGCRLDHGHLDREVYIPSVRDEIFGSSSLQRVEFPAPTSVLTNVQQAFSTDSLLRHLERGLLLTTRQGDIYATRKCRLAVFVTDQVQSGSLVRLERDQPLTKIFDFQGVFLPALRESLTGGGPLPSPSLTLGLGQRWRPSLHGPARLMLSLTLTHRHALYLVHKVCTSQKSLPPEISQSDDYDKFIEQYRGLGSQDGLQ